MSNLKIVGLTGLAGAGKDYVADRLVAKHGFVKIAIADPLKRICAELFGWNERRLWGPSQLRNEPDPALDGLTARKALQKLGTEFARDCYPDVWVLAFWRVFDEVEKGAGYHRMFGVTACGGGAISAVVVPDIRFINEWASFTAAGATIVKVVKTGSESPEWDHRSETELASCDDAEFGRVIRAEPGDLESLSRQADELAADVLGGES